MGPFHRSLRRGMTSRAHQEPLWAGESAQSQQQKSAVPRGPDSTPRIWPLQNLGPALKSQIKSATTWHYTFAKATTGGQQFQLLTVPKRVASVEDQSKC